jgi:predicted HTH transcriptional regulator
MTPEELGALLESLLSLGRETEWVEFKHNHAEPQEIGEQISAASNGAGLHHKERGYIVWGIEDQTLRVVGTTFRPQRAKVGNEELENWLATQLEPRIHFQFGEFLHGGCPVVILQVQRCPNRPVGFRGVEYVRVGSYKKRLKDHPEKERLLWAQGPGAAFEKQVATADLTADEALSLLDHAAFFEMAKQPLAETKNALVDRLHSEKLIAAAGTSGHWNITNLGAILFAKRLSEFEGLARKAVRVIVYPGKDRIKTVKEQVGLRGYAAGFEGLVNYIYDQLPRSEKIFGALRTEARAYPDLAVRELVANAIIHQDFSMTGVSPLVEVFTDRVEITNPGTPLIQTLRFIDEPPQSRNEALAALMRRLNICEERGSGIDKVIFEVEHARLPAPNFLVTEGHTKVILYGPRKLTHMDRLDKVRACYQHACLLYVSNQKMTNASLRRRLGIADRNYSTASRIISDTIQRGQIRPYDPGSTSKKHASYVPFWA